MSKIILIVWMLSSRDNVTMQYAVKFESEAACQVQATKLKDPRSSWRSYPVKYAECVMDVKP